MSHELVAKEWRRWAFNRLQQQEMELPLGERMSHEQMEDRLHTFFHKMLAWEERHVWMLDLPLAEFSKEPDGGKSPCIAVRPRGMGDPVLDPKRYYDFGAPWFRGHQFAHAVFNLGLVYPEQFEKAREAMPGYDVGHLCQERRWCCNPHHLEWQRAKNDGDEKGNRSEGAGRARVKR